MASGIRIALTRSQLSTDEGRRLVDLCLELGLDGDFSDTDLIELHKFLATVDNGSIPAVSHLKSLISDAVADGAISDRERALIHRQVERVIPPSERERVVAAREQKLWKDLNAWRLDPPSEKQINYIIDLGGDPKSVSNKGEASDLISSLAPAEDVITPRQKMVLRFWGKVPPPGWKKDDVSEWIDGLYDSNPYCVLAWEEYKATIGDDGSVREPDKIEFGVGPKWIEKLKQTDLSDDQPPDDPQSMDARNALIVAIVGGIIVLIVFLIKSS